VAATMGVVMTDIKRVLAYSTISQLGYMMLALGVGAYVAAIFHLMNHAFFKALLFLGSGSVNHSTHTFDMRLMGGLARYMPITFATFAIGGLSLAGVFPFAGFWSKDEILVDSWHENKALFAVAMFTVFLTAFYIFRAVFMTFSGEYRGGEEPEEGAERAEGKPHESPWVMALPLLVLSVPALLSGLTNVGGGVAHVLEGALPEGMHLHEAEFSLGIALSSTALALFGIWLAWVIYAAELVSSDVLRRAFGPVHTLVNNKYYMDHLYENVLVRGVLYRGVGRLLDQFDRYVVDGAVNGAAWVTRRGGATLRLAQSGQLQAYAVVALAGLLVMVGMILLIDP